MCILCVFFHIIFALLCFVFVFHQIEQEKWVLGNEKSCVILLLLLCFFFSSFILRSYE